MLKTLQEWKLAREVPSDAGGKGDTGEIRLSSRDREVLQNAI